MAAVAAGFDTGHLLDLLRVRKRELEVLDLVPVVGVGLGHHRLRVLAGDVHVALGAPLGPGRGGAARPGQVVVDPAGRGPQEGEGQPDEAAGEEPALKGTAFSADETGPGFRPGGGSLYPEPG